MLRRLKSSVCTQRACGIARYGLHTHHNAKQYHVIQFNDTVQILMQCNTVQLHSARGTFSRLHRRRARSRPRHGFVNFFLAINHGMVCPAPGRVMSESSPRHVRVAPPPHRAAARARNGEANQAAQTNPSHVRVMSESCLSRVVMALPPLPRPSTPLHVHFCLCACACACA